MDALALQSDEGRGMSAICFGEVTINLRSGDFRMGKPTCFRQVPTYVGAHGGK